MKYILFSDYDGTLCQNGEIDKNVSEAIKEFRDRGNLFAVVTGRNYKIGYAEFKESNKFSFDYIINSNGAFACDNKGDIVFSKYVDGSMFDKKTNLILSLIMRGMELTKGYCVVGEEKTLWHFYWNKANGNDKYNPFSDIEKIKKFSSIHLQSETVEQAKNVCNVLQKEFGEIINSSVNGNCIDINPAGVNKAAGIQNLIETIGIDEEYVWCVGDNYNDIPMIQKYHGSAIKNGVEELKNIAEHVCDDVGDVIRIILEKNK